MNITTTIVRFLLSALALGAQDESAGRKPVAPEPEPRIGVRFEGLLPGTNDPALAGEFQVEFRIYLSPQGGEPIWREQRRVVVAAGRMDLVLGELTPIPMAIHEATFKFLGASVGGEREVYPRFAIVNTVYASPEEVLRLRDAGTVATPALLARRRASGSDAPLNSYSPAGASVGDRTESPATWRAALLAARAAGGDLPDYSDWYAALSTCAREAAVERSGRYEWVLPWVYDTASHGAYNRLYRGRFQGCDYMDLSPANSYAFRVALPPEPDPATKEEAR